MRKVYIILCVVIILLLCSCKSSLIKPTLDDSVDIVTTDGTNFTVRRIENNVPDQEISIVVSSDKQEFFCCYDIASYLCEYDYSNDIVNNFAEIVNEYSLDDIRAYQFHWGIIYTLDEGITFSGLAKHNYNQLKLDDDVKQIIAILK